jgi:hypothetical protein
MTSRIDNPASATPRELCAARGSGANNFPQTPCFTFFGKLFGGFAEGASDASLGVGTG